MRFPIVFTIALFGLGCNITGPKENLSGHWTSQAIGHSYLVGFTLMQSGDAITGKACAISGGILLYKNAPVFGEYPDLQFTVSASETQPCCPNMAGTRFSGKQDGSKDIVGTYGNMDLRFKRSITPLCN